MKCTWCRKRVYCWQGRSWSRFDPAKTYIGAPIHQLCKAERVKFPAIAKRQNARIDAEIATQV